MGQKRTLEQIRKDNLRLKRQVRSLKAENGEYRKLVHDLREELASLVVKYEQFEHNSDQTIAKQAKELLEFKGYIQELESILDISTQPSAEE